MISHKGGEDEENPTEKESRGYNDEDVKAQETTTKTKTTTNLSFLLPSTGTSDRTPTNDSLLHPSNEDEINVNDVKDFSGKECLTTTMACSCKRPPVKQ